MKSILIKEGDKKNGDIVEVNNSMLPADKGRYYDIRLLHLKNNIFIPNKTDLESKIEN